ncbi:hypothetical protein OCK74_12280 [Chitinophagaceae bacterium LB-8]|uniref:Uncharacterized protein n=1 Tax=Paraflavisolibacter caeni TaxID=2982496 RepID=A0A9X2XVR1_9BACT|nr:hypothetical protein [Paraflavisolibacter caeni]MCU7549900.1 hypothetical protein [Paraflavisolibacter caeni]
MADPVGPVFTGGFEEFVINDETGQQYTILYLPDRNNDKLQQEGKAPHYYWVPGSVRLARFGDTGDFKFRHIHFVGVFDEDIHVGIEGKSEVVGGLLSFTTTSRYPTAVLKQAEEQLLNKFRGDNDRYWGWRTPAAPMFSMIPIRSNQMVVTNLAPGRNGTAPVENIPTGGGAAGGGGAPGGGAPGGAPRNLVRRANLNRTVIHGRDNNVSNLDAWAWELQGQGPGSVTGGENAFSGLMGALPSELIWAGFQGGASPITVAQNLMMPVWSQELYLKITGNWDRIFQHFSAHANAQYLWFSADIKAEFNNLRISGGIKVEIAIDGTIPGADKMEQEINKRIDAITKVFTDQAAQRIFAPPTPDVKPAEAPSGGILSSLFGGSGGLALKYRRDEAHLNLAYEETQYIRYLQPNTISSSFEGFYNVLKADPDAMKKYFIRLVMGDISRKITRIVKPVVNWPKPEQSWVGEPVAFLSAEVGYPSENGSIVWDMNAFQSTDTTEESNWRPAFARREEDEVENAPSGWEPDVTFVRRRVHLTEPIGMTDNLYVKVDVEKNVIDLDPEGGTPSTDNVIEVRADSAGKLEVGPIDVDVMLQDATQVVTVEFKALGRKHDGSERGIVSLQWRSNDMDQPRFWEIFTGQLDYVPEYQYRVTVSVKGTLFSAGMSWTGPWMDGQGNGPLMVHVPRQDETGVITRRMTPREIALEASDGKPVGEESRPPVPVPPGSVPIPTPKPQVSTPPGGRTTKDKPMAGSMENEPGATGRYVSGYGLEAPKPKAPPKHYEEVVPASGPKGKAKKSESRQERSRRMSNDQGWVKL